MLGNYANQDLAWKHVTSTDKYDDVSGSTTTTIKGRKESSHRLVRNSLGEEKIASGKVFTSAAVCVDDYIDGELIIAVDEPKTLGGKTAFYIGYLL